jgi:uncharacterized protein (DUF362 family)
MLVVILTVFISGTANSPTIKASQLVSKESIVANSPIGVPKGLKPGRVVWVWDEDATRQNITNDTDGEYWYENTDQDVVDKMLENSLMYYADKTTPAEAWTEIIKYFNSNRGKGSVGYTAGEKVTIKINLTTSNVNEDMNATPEVVFALLKQLVEVVGVAQEDITIGDPYRPFTYIYWDLCSDTYPNIHYVDGNGGDGREKTVASEDDVLKFSDPDPDHQNTSRLPQSYLDADYFINMPCLKSHESGGITLCAKNHQGSFLQEGADPSDQSAYSMHYALPEKDADFNDEHHRYRHLVDYMSHEMTGGKTLLYIVDGIWAGRNWQGWVEKWNMAPFDGDYPSSLFISQDPVAIDAVGYDFLLAEYADKTSDQQYPYMLGTDDYLLQAADPANWASDVTYDPEDDGTEISSQGVYEHWNNATDMAYTQIDFVKVVGNPGPPVVGVFSPNAVNLKIMAYPNPAQDYIYFEYHLDKPASVLAEVYSLEGRKMATIGNRDEYTGSQKIYFDVTTLAPGSYFMRLQLNEAGNKSFSSVKFQVN